MRRSAGRGINVEVQMFSYNAPASHGRGKLGNVVLMLITRVLCARKL